jgi:heme/copper-type cytochrome/quinol oxidase subunit 2
MVNKLELLWTLAVIGLITGVAVYSSFLYYNLGALPTNPEEYVEVIGHQWYWEFCYGNGSCFNSSYSPPTGPGSLGSVSGGALWAPAGATIELNITSADVVHSLNIPNLGIRLDAIPGRINHIAFTVPDVAPGTMYLIQCTEFCGQGHGIMRSFLVVT